MTSRLRWLAWVAQPIVIALVLWLMIDGPKRDVRYPLAFATSGLVALAEARSVIDHGAWWTLPEIGTPPGTRTPLPLRQAHLDLLLVRGASAVSGRPASVVNLAWMLMLICAGASSAWCLRRLGVSETGAWSCGVLFALSPFALGHTTRNFGMMPYLVPFAASAALQLAVARNLGETRGRSRVMFAGAAIAGFNAILPAVFGAFFIALGSVAGYVRSRRRAPLVIGAAVLAAMIVAGVVNLATPGRNPPGPAPNPVTAEMYGLKIRQLVTPIRGHWFPPFSSWALKDDEAHFPNGSDNDRLGLIATIGFLGLLVVFFVPSGAGRGDAGATTRAASRLLVAGVLFATLGGFGTLFSLLVSPSLDDFSGMMPFLAFFALAGLALAVDRVTEAPRPRRWRVAAWAAVLVIGLLDQSVATIPLRATRLPIHEEFTQLRSSAALKARCLQAPWSSRCPLARKPTSGGSRA
jgi:phosphoglycerol transferase